MKLHLDTRGSRAQTAKVGCTREHLHILRTCAALCARTWAQTSVYTAARGVHTTGYSILWPSVTACMRPSQHACGRVSQHACGRHSMHASQHACGRVSTRAVEHYRAQQCMSCIVPVPLTDISPLAASRARPAPPPASSRPPPASRAAVLAPADSCTLQGPLACASYRAPSCP